MKPFAKGQPKGSPAISSTLRATGVAAVLGLITILPMELEAQGRGNSRGRQESTVEADRRGSPSVLSVDLQSVIRQYYTSRPASQVASLPPGIRRNLARGKPLPPGIAKRFAPANLSQRIRVPQGYQLMEVGRDLLLVNVATNLIQDILFDVIR